MGHFIIIIFFSNQMLLPLLCLQCPLPLYTPPAPPGSNSIAYYARMPMIYNKHTNYDVCVNKFNKHTNYDVYVNKFKYCNKQLCFEHNIYFII